MTDRPTNHPLRELALLFLRLGATAFGGPAVHIALMEREVVERRRWLTRAEFVDLLGMTNLIPGPNSTELAIHIGHRRGGWPGLLVAGASFILPAALIVYALAWGYVRYGTVPQVAAVLYAVKPVMLAVVLHALLGLGRTAIKSLPLGIVAALAAAAAFLGVHELVVLGGVGFVSLVMGVARQRRSVPPLAALPLWPGLLAAAPVSVAVAPSGSALFLIFAKIGSVLFGSGYVLLAFLRADLVARLHWLSEQQLLDAVAVGQVTPGPVFTTATFIGYVVDGPAGALLATLGIFLPAFVFVALSGPLVPRIRRSPLAGAFLDGVNVASLALMFVVTCQLARGALVDLPTIVIAAGAVVVVLATRVSTLWLILAAGLLGVLLRASA